MDKKLVLQIEECITEKLNTLVRVKSWRPLGGGCINNAIKLETTEGPFFVKWNACCSKDMFAREAEGLLELYKAAQGMVAVPHVIAVKEVNETPGFLILEYLQPGRIDADDEKLGRGLAQIHKYANDNFGFYHDNYCGASSQQNLWNNNWATFFAENRINFLLGLIQNKRPFTASESNVFESFMLGISRLIPSAAVPSLIHGDLWSGNSMNTIHGPALIDPAAYYADREMEFGIITMFGGFSARFFEAYNEVFPLEPDWRTRNDIYQLYHVLNHYYLFGGSYGKQALGIAKKYI